MKIMEVPAYTAKELQGKNGKYSLCIPIYNEGERILTELQKAKDVQLHEKVDIILLDGGSTDGSTKEEVLKKYHVNTIIEMKETGIYRQAEALQAGFHFSIQRGYEGIITIDGNNKDGIEAVPDFIAKLEEGYDYIQGSRFLEGGKHENTPIMRLFAVKYIHAPFISFMCHKKYTDTTNLFRGYSIQYLTDERVQPFRKIFKSYELSTYLSTRADQLHLKTCEIPTKRCYPKGTYSTKVGRVKGNFKIIKSLLANALHYYNP